MSETVSLRVSPTSACKPISHGGPTCLTTFATNSLTISCQRDGHVGRHIDALDIGRDAIGAIASSADFAAQIAEESVETHDACILARVETLMYGSNRQDTGSCTAQGLCRAQTLRVATSGLKSSLM